MITSGVIYCIRQLSVDRWYVGQTTRLADRKQTHLRTLGRGIHHNRHLQRAWNKNGENDFVFEVLIVCPVWALNDLEQAYLEDPDTSWFNVAKCPDAPMRGRRLSEEAKNKISRAMARRFFSDEHRARISAALVGRKGAIRSTEQRAAMSLARKGKYFPPKHKPPPKTHCPHGHAYDEANTYVGKRRSDRRCRACHRIRQTARYHAKATLDGR